MWASPFSLHAADWAVFLGVLALTFAAGWYGRILNKQGSGRGESSLELLLMGRQLTLPLFIPTLVATWYGGIFGVTSLSFERGVFNFITQGVFWYGTYLVFAFFLVDRIRHFKATGLADLAGQLFGPRARKWTALLAWANLLPIGYVSGLGIFLGSMLGMDWWWAGLFGLGIVYAYALWGGLRAVVFPDFVQCIVMVAGVWALVFFCWDGYGGLTFLQSKLPAGHWDPTGGYAWSELFIWGFIALGTLVDPSFHQRVHAAKDTPTARKGILIATLIWVVFDMATTLGGLYARAILPEASPQDAYLKLGLTVLGPGWKGLFLAAILATILSTLDSFLFTAGATYSSDFRGKQSARHIQLAMLATGVLSWLLAPLFEGSIVAVWKTVGGLAAASLVPAMVYGLCRPGRLHEKGFLLSVASGVAGTAGFALVKLVWPSPWDEFYAGLAFSTIALGLALRRSPPPRKNPHRLSE